MKKIGFIICLFSFLISSCSFFHIHRMDIEQGNVIEDQQVEELRHGMTPAQVKNIMGEPILTHLFTQDRLEYVYTFQPGVGKFTKKRVSCIFQSGHLVEVKKTGN